MKSFKRFIAEKIPLSTYRDWVKGNDIDSGKESGLQYSDWFDGKNRVYIPLENRSNNEFRLALNKALQANDYEIIDWEKGLVRNTSKGGNPQKIGKLLTRFIEVQKQNGVLDNSAFWETWLTNYNKIRKQETAGDNDYYVVISRHPYDLAGMSADRWHNPDTKETKIDIDKWYREAIPKQNGVPEKLVDLKAKYAEKLKCLSTGWDSCKSILPRKSSDYTSIGEYSKKIPNEYVAGALVAYVVYQNDKNINNPLARRLLVPLHSIDDADETVLYIGPNYGMVVKGFREIVKAWLEEHQGSVDYDDYYAYEEEMYTGDVQGEVKIKNEYAAELAPLFIDDGWDIITNDGSLFEAQTSNDFSIIDAIFNTNKLTLLYYHSAYDNYNYEPYRHNDNLQHIFNTLLEDDPDIYDWFLAEFKERGGVPDVKDGDEYLPIDFHEKFDDLFSSEAEEMAKWYGDEETRMFVDEAKDQIKYKLNNTGFFRIFDDKIKIMISVDDEDESYLCSNLIEYNNINDAGVWESFREYHELDYNTLIDEVYGEGTSPTDTALEVFIRDEIMKE